MKEIVKKIDPSGSIEDVIYKILLLHKKPLHYKKIKELLIEVGYYELNRRMAPRDYTAIFRSLREGRFVRFERGYYSLKEVNLGSYLSVELKAEFNNTEEKELKIPKIEEKNNPEIENTKELSEVDTDSDNIIKLENQNMNSDEIYQESILPNEVVSFFQYYYDDEELKDVMERAKDEFISQFLPKFVAQEMTKIMEKNKA